jgi:glycosyltransferase involved in cell wall biosynthesis
LQFKNKALVKFITALSYWHYRRADGVVGVFKGIQTRLIDDVGIPKEKTLYITQAAEKIYETPVHDKDLEKRFKDKFTIVFAGSINPAQSFDTVLAAAKTTYDKGYDKVHFVIVGGGMSKDWLVNEVEKMGFSEHFSFEGFMPFEEVPRYQTVADALLVALTRSPLFEYGIPAKVQSYMASGKPIVGAMDGEGKRLINESGSGICADSGDDQGLAKAIMTLVDMKPDKRKAMGAKGRDYHFKHFERNYNLQRLIDFVFNDKRVDDTEYPD